MAVTIAPGKAETVAALFEGSVGDGTDGQLI